MTLEALPFVNWIFWAALSAGTLLVVGATELLGGTTRGYRLFMAWLVVALAAVLVLSDLALPGDAVAAGTEGVRRTLVLMFVAGSAGYLLASLAGWPRALLAVATAALGLAALVSLGLAGGTRGAPFFVGQLLASAIALGAVFAAMLLGHWYLVTPRLSPLPLRRMMWLLLAALAVQLGGIALTIAAFRGDPLDGTLAWLVWLRIGVGVLLPMLVTGLAMAASRASSLQASTGLLYVGLALVMAGSIAGSSLTYLTGVPV